MQACPCWRADESGEMDVQGCNQRQLHVELAVEARRG
jgi:hypothetical protein